MNNHMTMHSCPTAKKISGHYIGKPPEKVRNPPGPEPVHNPAPLSASAEDPGPSENGQVLGYVRLLLSDRHLDVADAPLPLRQDLQDPKARGLPHRLKELRLSLVSHHDKNPLEYDLLLMKQYACRPAPLT